MSLQKIGKYTEIFEASRRIQRPTKEDSMRITLIQNIAIAGLIEAGAPFEADNGEVIIDTGIDYKSVFINEIYPYLSKEGQTKVIFENQKKAELPAPDYHTPETPEPIKTPEIYNTMPVNTPIPPVPPTQPMPEEERPIENIQYQSEASRIQERKEHPADAMMEGLEDYNYEPDMDEAEETIPLEDYEYTPNQETAPAEAFSQPAEEPNEETQEPSQDQWSYTGQSVQNTYSETPEYSEPTRPETPEYTSSQPMDAPQDTFYTAPASENPTEFTPEQAYNAPQQMPSTDITALDMKDLTYERCKLELMNVITGESYKFTVHAAPLTENFDGRVIIRLKQLGRNNKYILTQQGTHIIFNFNNISIHAAQSEDANGRFVINYWVEGNEFRVEKSGAEYGGNGGNLVIYDEELELRIYPVPNVKDNQTGEMHFGNNTRGEAAYLYYIKNHGIETASSGVEREPVFQYETVNFILKARWDGNIIRLTAEEKKDEIY